MTRKPWSFKLPSQAIRSFFATKKGTYDSEPRKSCHSCYFDNRTTIGCPIHSDKARECKYFCHLEPNDEIKEAFEQMLEELRIEKKNW
jgi:hypothetical protein